MDPATADEAQLKDAFRNYQPQGQQSRMITPFSALFRVAGIGPEKVTASPAHKKPAGNSSKPRPSAAKAKVEDPPAKAKAAADFGGNLPPAIAGLLASLPTQGEGWTRAQRDAFMTTLAVVVDFCFPPGVVKAPKFTAEGEDAPDA